jgi:hypothetical protein
LRARHLQQAIVHNTLQRVIAAEVRVECFSFCWLATAGRQWFIIFCGGWSLQKFGSNYYLFVGSQPDGNRS